MKTGRKCTDIDQLLLAVRTSLCFYGQGSAEAAPQRVPTAKEDYGDLDTVGLSVMRRNGANNIVEDFGVFLGQRSWGWLIGIKDIVGVPHALEEFETLEEMKEVWVLD